MAVANEKRRRSEERPEGARDLTKKEAQAESVVKARRDVRGALIILNSMVLSANVGHWPELLEEQSRKKTRANTRMFQSTPKVAQDEWYDVRSSAAVLHTGTHLLTHAQPSAMGSSRVGRALSKT